MTRLFNIGQGLLSQYFEFSDVNWERVLGEEVPMLDLDAKEGLFKKLSKLFK